MIQSPLIHYACAMQVPLVCYVEVSSAARAMTKAKTGTQSSISRRVGVPKDDKPQQAKIQKKSQNKKMQEQVEIMEKGEDEMIKRPVRRPKEKTARPPPKIAYRDNSAEFHLVTATIKRHYL
ncbi:unnamed protein product [Caenorhabditis brenneri]